LFKERKTKLLTLLSLLSALVVISTAFAGASIYAQTADEDYGDDSELTTFEEEALNDEEDTSVDESEDAVDDSGATSIADIEGLFDGLTVCNVGNAEINESETEIAAAVEEDAPESTPSISVTVMLRGEIVEAAANETSTSSAETEIASADCMVLGENDEETSTSAESEDAANGDDSEMTTFEEEELAAEEEDDSNAGSSDDSETSIASDYAEPILAIEGQDFAPGQVVLIFSGNSLVGIDDVDEDGSIDAKVPVNDIMGEIRLVESGTARTQTFAFDGETLISAEGVGDITVDDGSEDEE